MRKMGLGLLLGLAGLVAIATADAERGTASVSAPDPVPIYPDNYKVLLENERVRVVDFRLRKGQTEEAHSHPAHVAVFLADFKIRFTLPDGTTAIRDASAGEVAYSPGTIHASENIGDTDAHGILIEIKAPAGREARAAATEGLLTAVTLIHGLPGQEEDLMQHLRSLAAPTRAEPGCVAYDLYQSPVTPSEFMRFEAWTSPEALEAHKRTPHLQRSFERRQREGWTTEILTWERVPD